MKCPDCGNSRVVLSKRHGAERIFKHIYPKRPYRCEECWGRFWIFENPLKTWKTKVIVGFILCFLIFIIVFPLYGPQHLFPKKRKMTDSAVDSRKAEPGKTRSPLPSVSPSLPPVQSFLNADNATRAEPEKTATNSSDRRITTQSPEQELPKAEAPEEGYRKRVLKNVKILSSSTGFDAMLEALPPLKYSISYLPKNQIDNPKIIIDIEGKWQDSKLSFDTTQSRFGCSSFKTTPFLAFKIKQLKRPFFVDFTSFF